MKLTLTTRRHTDLVDITPQVRDALAHSGLQEGLVHIYSLHTTAAVTVNEGADPDVATDIAVTLDHLIPWRGNYRHQEGNSAAHLKTSLVGPSELIPVSGARLVLGTWQKIFFCEFDGPRTRSVFLTFLPALSPEMQVQEKTP